MYEPQRNATGTSNTSVSSLGSKALRKLPEIRPTRIIDGDERKSSSEQSSSKRCDVTVTLCPGDSHCRWVKLSLAEGSRLLSGSRKTEESNTAETLDDDDGPRGSSGFRLCFAAVISSLSTSYSCSYVVNVAVLGPH